MKRLVLLAGLLAVLLPPIQGLAGDKPPPGLRMQSNPDQWLTPDGGLRIPLPGAGELKPTHFAEHANGDISLHAESNQGEALLTFGPDTVMGQIRHGHRRWQLVTDADGTRAFDLDQGGLSWNHCPGPATAPWRKSRQAPVATSQALGDPAGTVIDLLAIYNPAMAERYPGDLIQTRINHFVALANQGFSNSGLDLGVRLVGLSLYDYNNFNTNGEALEDIAFTLAGETRSGLTGLAEERDELGADLVILFRPHDIERRGSCGVAFFPDENNDPALGVNIVSDGRSSWSVCFDDVMTHEIGHNLGASHQVGLGGGDFDTRGAAFVQLGRFTTVMASFGTGQPDRFRGLNLFSNPAVDCGAEACGDAAVADNSAVIRSTMASVAGYRDAVSNAPVPRLAARADTDNDGDGIPDWLDALPFDASEQLDSDRDGRGNRSDAFPFSANKQDDADGDRLHDGVDPDDDNDGTPDEADAFPLDPEETTDSDGDGVGDVRDAFPADRFEFEDSDGDGLGNHADPDDDNDGFEDFHPGRTDLLVVSAGNNRILRFDATTGQSRGIEVLGDEALLTFQSSMAWRENDQTLLYTAGSALQRQAGGDRAALGTWVPAYATLPGEAALGTGFPTGLATLTPGIQVAVARMGNPDLAFFRGQERARLDGALDWAVDPGETHLDVLTTDSGGFILGTDTRTIYAADALQTRYLSGPEAPFLVNPRRLAMTPDGRLLVTDAGRDAVVGVDATSGESLGVLARLRPAGHQGADGLAVTADGTLLVAAAQSDAVLAFDVNTGEYLGPFIGPAVGLDEPRALLLVPSPLDRYPRDPARVMRPNAGLWADPANDGRGFDIEVFGDRLTAIWYTYDANGLPTWYLSSGRLTGFEYESALLRFQRGPDGTATSTEVGRLALSFSDERRATAHWDVDGIQGQDSLGWLAFSTDPAREDGTGIWGRADGPGWGLSVAQQGDLSLVITYLYDSDGSPRWLLSDAVGEGDSLDFNLTAFFSDSLCPDCAGPADFTTSPAGSMSLDLDAASGTGLWQSELALPAPLEGDWSLEATDIIRFSELPERPR